MLTANQLLTFSEEEVEGVTVLNMYDWSSAAGQDCGLIDLQNDGMGGISRVPTETYYAYRLMVRGLNGGKERLAQMWVIDRIDIPRVSCPTISTDT